MNYKGLISADKKLNFSCTHVQYICQMFTTTEYEHKKLQIILCHTRPESSDQTVQ
jgi:hypothetical protein